MDLKDEELKELDATQDPVVSTTGDAVPPDADNEQS